MVGCCADCFGDSFLQKQIEEQFGTETGVCSYCGASAVLLADPIDLRDFFELFLGVYRRGRGKSLVRWLKADWSLFDSLNDSRANDLLSDILADATIRCRRFLPWIPDDVSSLERWQEFRNELKHQNRFFPKRIPDLGRLAALLDAYLCADEGCVPRTLYRARICDGDRPYGPDEMGRPPEEQAANGRANPAGIPYLYLASDIDTAIAEVRPHTGEKVCVAGFAAIPGLRIADLRNPRKTISPFLSDEDGISSLRNEVNLLCQLGEELTRPVLPKTAHLDYLPSQYLCEFIKSRGFDGVMYGSSIGDGVNVALFEKELDPVGDVGHYTITRVSVDRKECRSRA